MELCDRCDAETPHAVQIELRSESKTGKNVAFSREPYRVSECSDCGFITATRMNDA
jgi:hypothetical protein